jgi:Caspase domain
MKAAMTRHVVLGLVVALVLALFGTRTSDAAPASSSSAPLRRFALVIGSNSGGGERDRLRYAGHDATTVADVLQQLGGVSQADLSLLSEPDTHAVDTAFDTLSQRVRDERKHGQRIELVVYYSGHADESGILLGGSHYDYSRLRERIRDVPADVRIAIVDSCASGSFTRAKGGTKTAPFLRDSSNQVEGFAFLSSSSATEDAQESDKIGASFFTYFFIAGLRGLADANHDNKITLTEAYQYAYQQTLSRTQNTVHGPQHASYDMHLSGTGDVVITDLRSTDSTLVLPAPMRGHVTIVDNAGRVALELIKQAGEPLSIALPNDTYSLFVDTNGKAYAGTITLDRGAPLMFDQDALHPASPEETVARGVQRDGDDDDDHDNDRGNDDDKKSPWYREVGAGFGGGLRFERPQAEIAGEMPGFDSLLTIGGTSREIHGSPVVGVATTADLSLGMTLGGKTEFAYDASVGFGPGVFLGDAIQLGATVGFGLSQITGGILPFGFKVPTEAFVILDLSPNIRPVAYFRQSYIFDSDSRQNGSKMAIWGADEAEAGAGLKFTGKLDGFVYGSVREMENIRYWGVGVGAIL